jgi:signal peptidase I
VTDTMYQAPTPMSEEPPRRAGKALRSGLEWVAIIVGALLVALVVKTFLIQAFYIPSASMEPQLAIGDRVLVNKLSYRLHDVNRGDIVVFERPPGDAGDPEIKDLIKRVVALPGETVSGRGGQIFIDDRPLREPYIGQEEIIADFGPTKVPNGRVFVMGDNRDNSKDSRVFGPIKESIIVGRAFVRVWPASAFDLL